MRGATLNRCDVFGSKIDFNPRAPCGARPKSHPAKCASTPFQSTRPLRGATARFLQSRCAKGYFNPRAPCGARPVQYAYQGFAKQFQSTRPLRGATDAAHQIQDILRISIHAPLAGRDSYTDASNYNILDFNPRAPCGARHTRRASRACALHFNPRAPCGARQ